MSTTILETFQATLRTCFDSAMTTMLGEKVGDGIYDLLERRGIQRSEIPTRFKEVVSVLNEAFGTSAMVLVYRTTVALYAEYSVWPKFGFYDSLPDQVTLLKDKVLSEMLTPKHTLTIDQPRPRPIQRE